jgi:hypothetical protein
MPFHALKAVWVYLAVCYSCAALIFGKWGTAQLLFGAGAEKELPSSSTRYLFRGNDHNGAELKK